MLEFDLSPLIGVRPGESLTFLVDEGPQRLDDVSVEFLRGTLHFTRVQGGILVEGALETRIEVECVRCLESFSLPATLEIEEVIGLGGRPREGITYSLTVEGWFNAAPVVREQVWVSIPIKPLCRPDCQGLCPVCGQNLNRAACQCHPGPVDPRWAALASFLTGEKG